MKLSIKLSSFWRFLLVATGALAAVLLFDLLLATHASADVVTKPTTRQLLSDPQMWAAIIGGLVTLLGYVVNRIGPWVTQPVKGFVTALLAAIGGALYTAIFTHVFGANAQTLELVLTAVVGTFAAHGLIWKPTGVAAWLTKSETTTTTHRAKAHA
jgi:hypothetical protein